MKKLNLICWVVGLWFAVTACTDDDKEAMSETVSAADRDFVLNAIDGRMFAIQAGQLAVAKGDTSRQMIDSMLTSVRSFGQTMVTDHTATNEALKKLADRKQVAISTTLSVGKKQKIDSLSMAYGATFDVLYTRMMVVSHQDAIGLFEAASSTGDDHEIKSWASDQLPTLKHHVEVAKMIRDSIQ
jgi:putative membrane protein